MMEVYQNEHKLLLNDEPKGVKHCTNYFSCKAK